MGRAPGPCVSKVTSSLGDSICMHTPTQRSFSPHPLEIKNNDAVASDVLTLKNKTFLREWYNEKGDERSCDVSGSHWVLCRTLLVVLDIDDDLATHRTNPFLVRTT